MDPDDDWTKELDEQVRRRCKKKLRVVLIYSAGIKYANVYTAACGSSKHFCVNFTGIHVAALV